MLTLKGIGVSKGIACAKILHCDNSVHYEEESAHFSQDEEILKYNQATEYVYESLDDVYNSALERYGDEYAQVFKAHQEILNDQSFKECVYSCITNEKMSAYQAVKRALSIFEGIFLGLESVYFRERVHDLREVASKLLRVLNGIKDNGIVLPGYPVIIASKTILASDIVGLDKSEVAGFITKHGGVTSHLAILAKTMGIPFVFGIDFDFSSLERDDEVIIDGEKGIVIINPDVSTKEFYHNKKIKLEEQSRTLSFLRDKPCMTKDGREIRLYANISSIDEVNTAIRNSAQGVGIFRSEMFFMQFSDYPDEETQYSFYRELLEKMGGRRVVVRTLDAGADKAISYIKYPEQENPALGMRAIRISLRDRKQFLVQLKALLRAGCHGKLYIMLPLIVNADEIIQVRQLIDEAKKILKRENKQYADNIPLGIMIETPAAAMTADILSEYADFFSIGTNDLTQYSLAADRTNPDVSDIYVPEHKGILRMIKFCIDAAKERGIWAEVCGDITSETFLKELLTIGVDSIAVVPQDILERKKQIRAFSIIDQNKQDCLKQ